MEMSNKTKIAFNVNFVSSLVGATIRQLFHWDKVNLVKPSILKSQGKGSIRLYSFEDIVELKTIIYLKNSGISTKRIAQAIEFIKNNYPYNKPLKDLTLYSNKKDIIFSNANPNEVRADWVAATQNGQLVCEFVVPFGSLVDDINNIIEKYNDRIDKAEQEYKNGELISAESIREKYFGKIQSGINKGRNKKRSA